MNKYIALTLISTSLLCSSICFSKTSFTCDLNSETPPFVTEGSGNTKLRKNFEANPGEGPSCGANPDDHEYGVGCHAIECLKQKDVVESIHKYKKLSQLDDVVRRVFTPKEVKNLTLNTSDFCPRSSSFSYEEKVNFIADILKATINFESSTRSLMVYDDILNKKVVTSRGFGSQTLANCIRAGALPKGSNYCELHKPDVAVKCLAKRMIQLTSNRRSKPFNVAMGAAFGVWKVKTTRAFGGRYKEMKKNSQNMSLVKIKLERFPILKNI